METHLSDQVIKIFIISIDLVFGIKYTQVSDIYLLPQGIKR